MSASDSIRAETKAALTAMADEAREMQAAAGGSVADAVAGWLAPRYAQAARAQLAGLEGPARLKLLRAFAQDWALLQKGEHRATRLRQEQEWLQLEREKTEERMRKRFAAWARDPANLERFFPSRLGPEEQARRIREIFHRTEPRREDPTAEAPAQTPGAARAPLRPEDPAESGEIRPNPTESDP